MSKKIISLIISFCFLIQSIGFSQSLISFSPLPTGDFPHLKYLSLNSHNPFNYFNFLLDKGELINPKPEELSQEAKKLINYFFLGITLSDESFWVNLQPGQEDRITSQELSKTDLGRTLLEQDLLLKKDMAKLLHPKSPSGKTFWNRLYSEADKLLGKAKLKKTAINTSNRVWITPDKATILETEDGALIVEASLKVLLESEYLQLQTKDKGSPRPENLQTQQQDLLQTLSESLMKELLIPEITKEINQASRYVPLRQIYHSLILAQWFKRKVQGAEWKEQGARLTNPIHPYELAINQSWTEGLESQTPWSKDLLFQEYLKSLTLGEYKLQETISGLKRMYFSGGVDLTGENSIGRLLQIIPSVSSPLLKREVSRSQNLEIVLIETNKDGKSRIDPGEIRLIANSQTKEGVISALKTEKIDRVPPLEEQIKDFAVTVLGLIALGVIIWGIHKFINFYLDGRANRLIDKGNLRIEGIEVGEREIKIRAKNNIRIKIELSLSRGINEISVFRKGNQIIKRKKENWGQEREEFKTLKNKILKALFEYVEKNKDNLDKEVHLRLLELKIDDIRDHLHSPRDVEEFINLIREISDYRHDNLLEIGQILKDKSRFYSLFYWLKLANSKNQNLDSALKEYQDLSELLKDEDEYVINKAIWILDKNREITLQKFTEWINIVRAQGSKASDFIHDLDKYYKTTTLLLETKEYDPIIVFWVDRLLKQYKEVEPSTLLGWIRTVKENNKDPKLFLEALENIYKDFRGYFHKDFLEEENSLLTDVLIKNGGKFLLTLWDIPDTEYLSILLKLSSTRLLEGYVRPNLYYDYAKQIKNLLLQHIDLLEGGQILSLFKNNLYNDFLKGLLIKKVESEPSFVPLLLEEIRLSADGKGDTNSQLASILIEAKNTTEVIKKIIYDGSARVIKGEHDDMLHYVLKLGLLKNKEKLKELLQEDPNLFNKLFDLVMHRRLDGLDLRTISIIARDITEIKITPEQVLNSLKVVADMEGIIDFIHSAVLKDKNLFSVLLSYLLEKEGFLEVDKMLQEGIFLSIIWDQIFPDEWRLGFIYESLEKFINLPPQLQEQLTYIPIGGFKGFLINNMQGIKIEHLEQGIELLAKALKETPVRIRNIVKLFDALVEVGFSGSNWDVNKDEVYEFINIAQNEALISFIETLKPYGFQFTSQTSIEVLVELFNQKNEILPKLNEIRKIAPDFKYVPVYKGVTDPDTLFIRYLINKPELFFENLEAILSRFNPAIFSYSEKIKTTFFAFDNPSYLVETILDDELKDVLIRAKGNILEAIKSSTKQIELFSRYLINRPEIFKKNLEMILQVFNPNLISELTDGIERIDLELLEYIVPYTLGASDFKAKLGRVLLSLYKESDEEFKHSITEFILKERQDIELVFGYLKNNKVTPSENFLKNFLRKNDVSLLDILLPIKDDAIFSYSRSLAPQINLILNTEKRYETIRQALNYLAEIGIIIKDTSLSYATYDKQIDGILDRYLKGDIGDKKFLNELSNACRQVKADAFREIISRNLTEEEKKFLDNPDVDLFIGNLVGLYFRIQNAYPQVCEKIVISIDNFLKFQDIKKFHEWLYKESEWNKEIYEELIHSGYDLSLWDKGISRTLPVESVLEDIGEEMRKQTEQLIELAAKHKVEIDSQYREKGIASYKEAEEFVMKYFLDNDSLPQEIKDLVKAILEDTKKYEEQYKNKVLSSKKVTVEINKNFLKDTYSGVGIPGCFAPHGSNNQMPMIHALEANALFLRVYDANNKMIANAVLVLTPQGVVIQGLYNASNFDLDRIAFEGLAELLLEDMAPSLLFVNSSAGGKEALKYITPKEIIGVKKNTLNTDLYFDFSHTDSQSETRFKMDGILTKQDLLAKSFKPSLKEIGEKADIEKAPSINKPLSKEDKKMIMQELFTTEKLNELELSPVLKNIEKIIFEWDEGKIEEVISSIISRSSLKRRILEEEKIILKDKLLEIKNKFHKKESRDEFTGSAAAPEGKSTSSAINTVLEPDRNNIISEEASSGLAPATNLVQIDDASSTLDSTKSTLDSSLNPGGIDLSSIELILEDKEFISSLNPADLKVLLAAKALEKDNWNSLALLRIHEVIRLLKDGLITEIQNQELLLQVLEQLRIKASLDPQALEFFQFLQSQKPLSEIKLVLSN